MRKRDGLSEATKWRNHRHAPRDAARTACGGDAAATRRFAKLYMRIAKASIPKGRILRYLILTPQ